MKINVDKLLSEGWRFFHIGTTKVLGPPKGSVWQTQAAILETTSYNGETIRFFKFATFPWDDYK